MKVIFLDFDGVINDWYTFNDINNDNINILKIIVKETNAKIVVTSSNKYQFQRDNSKYENTLCYKLYAKALNNQGLEIYDFTPYIDENKETEISEYLRIHLDIEEFLILDDDQIFVQYKEHQVFLDWYKGLTSEHIEPALNILNGMLGFYPPNVDITESYETRLIRINKYYRSKR